ncbi:hypothetical protein MHAS_01416 [Mycolicibacterium hassiacum DSM 44199]|nr:hypothetical protein MHAS_01416 [Mycolicibacterium hassiacum DSM 44199]
MVTRFFTICQRCDATYTLPRWSGPWVCPECKRGEDLARAVSRTLERMAS